MADWNIFQPTDASKPIHQILSGIQRGGFYVTNDNDEDRSRQALLDALAAAGYPAPSSTDPVYVHRTDTGNLERNTGNGWDLVIPPPDPFAQAAGVAEITGGGTINRSTVTVTFPSGRFTQPPIVEVSSGAWQYSAYVASVTADSASIGLRHIENANWSSTNTIYWRAAQMTPTSAAG